VLVDHVADDVVIGVSELRAADVIVEDTRAGSLSYRIVHPVLAEVAYEMVPVVVRQQLHARLARALGPIASSQRKPETKLPPG
jgi:predicted ATPase